MTHVGRQFLGCVRWEGDGLSDFEFDLKREFDKLIDQTNITEKAMLMEHLALCNPITETKEEATTDAQQ